MKPDAAGYQDGDRLDDGRGNVGRVRQCTSKTTGRTFLRVLIVEGPRKDSWDWPDQFGPPSIDWSTVEYAVQVRCITCERRFRTAPDPATGLARVYCRTCQAWVDRINADEAPESRVPASRRRFLSTADRAAIQKALAQEDTDGEAR